MNKAGIMARSISRGRASRRQTLGALALLLGCAATVGTALVFEHGFGYIPCALCLKERIPYYVAVGLALVAAALGLGRAPVWALRALFAAIGLVMIWSLYLAVFHAGVEWHWWAGPTDCAAAAGVDLGGDLLSTIDAVHPPACDRAAGRFLGLSFAGWNAVASLVLAASAFGLALSRPARR